MDYKDFKTCFSGNCGFCEDCYHTINFKGLNENSKSQKNYKHVLNVLNMSTGEKHTPPPVPENPWEMYQRMNRVSEASFRTKELKIAYFLKNNVEKNVLRNIFREWNNSKNIERN